MIAVCEIDPKVQPRYAAYQSGNPFYREQASIDLRSPRFFSCMNNPHNFQEAHWGDKFSIDVVTTDELQKPTAAPVNLAPNLLQNLVSDTGSLELPVTAASKVATNSAVDLDLLPATTSDAAAASMKQKTTPLREFFLKVRRIDSTNGWGQDLSFVCCDEQRSGIFDAKAKFSVV